MTQLEEITYYVLLACYAISTIYAFYLSRACEEAEQPKGMARYWVSWWTGYYEDEGCTKPPFTVWKSGSRDRDDDHDEVSLCAMLDAPNEETIWKAVKHYFPDSEQRFCEARADNAVPSDRFRGEFGVFDSRIPREFYV